MSQTLPQNVRQIIPFNQLTIGDITTIGGGGVVGEGYERNLINTR